MRKTITLLTILLFVVFMVGCENSINPIEPTNNQELSLAKTDSEGMSLAKQDKNRERKNVKVEICHLTGNGKYVTIEVDENAVAAHKAHGDLVPLSGEWLFYMNNNLIPHYYDFDAGTGYYPYNATAQYNVNEVVSLNKISCDDFNISFVSTYVSPGDLLGTVLMVTGSVETMTGTTFITRANGTTLTIDWEAFPLP